MTPPKFDVAAKAVLQDILVAMLKTEEDAPSSAESHLARAAFVLQQFVDCAGLDNDLQEQLKYCMSITHSLRNAK